MSSEDLTKVKSEKLIHLTSQGRNSGRPHTVELWFATDGSKVYLSHEGRETDWIKNVKKNGKVSFEIGGKYFIGTARCLEDSVEENWTAKAALYEKYYGKASKEVIADWFSLSKLFLIKMFIE